MNFQVQRVSGRNQEWRVGDDWGDSFKIWYELVEVTPQECITHYRTESAHEVFALFMSLYFPMPQA